MWHDFEQTNCLWLTGVRLRPIELNLITALVPRLRPSHQTPEEISGSLKPHIPKNNFSNCNTYEITSLKAGVTNPEKVVGASSPTRYSTFA